MIGHLRGLESEFGESSNAIRLELNKLEEAGLLKSESQGNKKLFGANTNHPLFKDIHSIILKYTGVDQILEKVIQRLGDLEQVFLTGDLGKGLDSPLIELIFVGDVDKDYLNSLVSKTEKLIKKTIQYSVLSSFEFSKLRREILPKDHLVIWVKE